MSVVWNGSVVGEMEKLSSKWSNKSAWLLVDISNNKHMLKHMIFVLKWKEILYAQ